ncbi:transcriptional regulator NrdR [archaeon]|nr:transcriptional regulator NrdR [archaeon]
MKCPFCHHTDSKVMDKRETELDMATRRRRECLGCEKRYTTYERIEDVSLVIIKKDGRKEAYSREKLKKGINRACEKRDVDDIKIKKIVDHIEAKLRDYKDSEVNSTVVGKWVMSKLKQTDKIAYIRFASIYKEFKDIEEMKEELKKIAK